MYKLNKIIRCPFLDNKDVLRESVTTLGDTFKDQLLLSYKNKAKTHTIIIDNTDYP